MSTTAPYTDRYDLALTTTSADAAAHYRAAIECLQYVNVGAVGWLEQAVTADEGFALAHATLARAYQLSGKMDAAKTSITRSARARGRRHAARASTNRIPCRFHRERDAPCPLPRSRAPGRFPA